MATPTNASAIAKATAANQAAAAKAAASAAAAKTAQAKQAAAKQTALTALQNSINAKTTGVGAINSAAAATAGQTAIDLSNQYMAAQQAANTAAAYTPVDVPAPVYDTTPTSAATDAWAILSGSIGSWFGGDPTITQQATDFIKNEMQNNIGPEQALVDMRNQQFYKTRFAGNTTRVANGLNALSEAEYVGLENTYTDYFTAYGQKTLATQTQLATFIGNAVSPTEVKDRLDMAVVQVQQADPTVKAALKQFYPNITDANLVSYFLAPEDTLPVLQRQVQAADIGAAAIQQGLSTSKIAAEGLAAYGTTYQQAQTGYGKIAEVLPAGQKLSQIYNAQTGINYNQAEAEKQYLMNSGAATLEQQKLIQLEQAQFSGKSGVVGANVAAGYSGSLGKSIQGSF